MLVARETAEHDLQRYRARLQRCVTEGIRDFLAEQAPTLAFMRRGTQANLVRDYIVRNIKREFPDGEDGVVHKESRGLFLLTIRNRYALRFKKLDRRWRTRNIPTQLSLDYLLQQPLVLFPELNEIAHLNVGYQPGITLSTSSVWITCPNGDRLDWKFSISENEEEPQYLPDRLQVRKPARQPIQARPRRRPILVPQVEADGSSG